VAIETVERSSEESSCCQSSSADMPEDGSNKRPSAVLESRPEQSQQVTSTMRMARCSWCGCEGVVVFERRQRGRFRWAGHTPQRC
jgi:hypothetical protein